MSAEVELLLPFFLDPIQNEIKSDVGVTARQSTAAVLVLFNPINGDTVPLPVLIAD